MEDMKKQKKNKIIKGMALLGLFLLIFGVSYALFSVMLTGKKKNRITTGNLSLELLNESGNAIDNDTIGLENAVPMTDEEGRALTPYTFTIKNSGTIDAEYSLSLEDLDLEASEERLADKYVKMALTRGTYKETPYLLSEIKDRILDAGIIKKGESITYSLNLWLDEDSDENAMNKVFSTKLKVNGMQETLSSVQRIIIIRQKMNGTALYDNSGLVTVYGDGMVYANGKHIYIEDSDLTNKIEGTGTGSRKSKERQLDYEYKKYTIERSGIDTTGVDLSTVSKMNTFIKNVASKDESYNNLLVQDKLDLCKKYNIENCTEENDYYNTYLNELYDNNQYTTDRYNMIVYETGFFDNFLALPTLAAGCFANTEFLEVSVEEIRNLELPSSLKRIMILEGTNKSNVKSLTLPDGLEEIVLGGNMNKGEHIVDLELDELVIPASVKYVQASAFSNKIKKIKVLGSTDGWASTWNSGYNGTIEYAS